MYTSKFTSQDFLKFTLHGLCTPFEHAFFGLHLKVVQLNKSVGALLGTTLNHLVSRLE